MFLHLWHDGSGAHDEAKDQIERDEELVQGTSIALKISMAVGVTSRILFSILINYITVV